MTSNCNQDIAFEKGISSKCFVTSVCMSSPGRCIRYIYDDVGRILKSLDLCFHKSHYYIVVFVITTRFLFLLRISKSLSTNFP